MKLQHKTIGLHQVKPIESSSGDMVFEGYGAVFDVIDSYGDSIVKGAFAGAVKAANDENKWPAMLLQHGGWSTEDSTPIGIWTSIEEDDYGLKVTGKLANTERGRDIYALMKMEPRAAIDGLSIGYYATKWRAGEGAGQPERILEEVELVEISPVTFPANEKATVTSVKSIEELQSLRDIERHMRDAWGASNGEAKALISKMKAATLREAEAESKAQSDLMAALQKNLETLRG